MTDTTDLRCCVCAETHPQGTSDKFSVCWGTMYVFDGDQLVPDKHLRALFCKAQCAGMHYLPNEHGNADPADDWQRCTVCNQQSWPNMSFFTEHGEYLCDACIEKRGMRIWDVINGGKGVYVRTDPQHESLNRHHMKPDQRMRTARFSVLISIGETDEAYSL